MWPARTTEEQEKAIDAAARAISKGLLLVMPTDTVYGIAADAFDADAVRRLLAAKGRERDMPPPVLIGEIDTVDALMVGLPDYARTLIQKCWPGPLTIVGKQQESLQWDLGDTFGTVAVRVPRHDLARDLLRRTGPLAVSSANLTGQPAATTAEDAEEMLGDRVRALIDAGPAPGVTPSTIIDVTTERPRLLRRGALAVSELNTLLEDHDLTVLEEG
ncbi:MAG: L-threonylcarbamoyladenylate synthase [Nocardioides sp.]|uniref:L-threonylcarbamoyladenylate synthase n=1 Tax=Nocardioides sp. TaxID=35761 RepID=UPI0039E370F8